VNEPKSLLDLETERELLGTCIAYPKLAPLALEKISPEHLSQSLHRKILMAFIATEAIGKEPSEFDIDSRLSGDSDYDSAGGLRFLIELHSSAAPCKPETAIVGLAEAVRRNYLRRKFRNEADAAARRAEDKLNPIADVISGMRESVTALEDESQDAQRSMASIASITNEMAPVLHKLSEKRGEMLGFSTGFRRLDRLSAGLPPGSLTVLAARPSMGKTAFALDIALRVAMNGIPVAIFSLETQREMLNLRMVCRHGRIDLSAITSGRADDDVWREVAPAVATVRELPIYIDDRPRVKANDLRWRIRSAARRLNARLVIVDYLQLSTGKGDTRNDEVATVSGELQAAARELGHINSGALIALSQLNRVGDRERPRLSHLRDSGAIEQDADAVWFLCESDGTRPGQFAPSTKDLEIAKSRNGPTGIVCFDYIGQCMAFEEHV